MLNYFSSESTDPQTLNYTALVTGIILTLIHFFGFFFFYCEVQRKNIKSFLSELMMLICFIESILGFELIIVIIGFETLCNVVKYRQVFKFLTFGIFSSNNIQNLFGFHSSLCSALLTVEILLEIFYCLEVIFLFKNPISDFSIRPNLYFIFSIILCVISFSISYSLFSTVFKDKTYNLRFYLSLSPNCATIGIMMLTGIISLIYTISCMYSELDFYSQRKKLFIIRHILYTTLNVIIYVYPIVELCTHQETNKIIIFYNFFTIFLGIFRILDLGGVRKICFKVSENEPLIYLTNDIDKATKFSVEPRGDFLDLDDGKMTRHLTEKKIKKVYGSKEIDISKEELEKEEGEIKEAPQTLSSLLQRNFLMEYMFYIINGILRISELMEKQKGIYSINDTSYKEFGRHQFKQVSPKDNMSMRSYEEKEIQIESKVILEIGYCKDFRYWLESFNGGIQLIEHGPFIFRNILKMDNLGQSEIEKSFNLAKNIQGISNLSMSEGKSGSFFFFTYDNRFIIKTISKRELETMVKNFLKPYYEFITENNFTLLVRTYGVYTLCYGLSRVNVILMENVTPIDSSQILWKFDLKGSLKGRLTKKIDLESTKKVTYKDRDFLDLKTLKKDFNIKLESDKVSYLLEVFRYDTQLLRNNGLMDYSFFLIVCKNDWSFDPSSCLIENRCYYSKDKEYIYFIAIIDYLTLFDKYKNIENKVKTIFNYSQRKDISAVNPTIYEDRFSRFILSNVFHVMNFKSYRTKSFKSED